jgi:hypothetical protein
MRKKTLQLIVTFASTPKAIQMESVMKQKEMPGRLIPTPTQITAGCGLAWMAPLEAKEDLLRLMEEEGVEAEKVVELMI